jgi:outer membrane biosynthesis protein TonB
MSRIGKLTVAASLLLPLSLGGCGPKKGTASPEDYFPLIQVALAGGETAAMIGHTEAIKAKSFGGCVAASTLITAFDGAGAVLAGKLSGKIIIPGVELDVSECLALREAAPEEAEETEPEAGEENASFSSPVVVAVMTCGYAPPEEEAAEEKPAEEPAAEEPAAEEKPAEEAAEEKPAEEPAEEAEEPAVVEETLKGNPDAAALVETAAGFTMAVVLHYATKLKATNCKKGTAALGAINYVNGMIKPIADEIAEPDGMVSIPSVAIDLSECAEG